MGNGTSSEMGYYGATGESISTFEDGEGFVVVSVNPTKKDEGLEEPTAGPRSPFEQSPVKREKLEGSVDSGYDGLNAAKKSNSEKTTPEHIPGRPPADADLEDPDCRTAKSLGNHHAYFGVRMYRYNDTQCEGNKHILDNDL